MDIQEIELARLLPHPRNANVMPPAAMAKLRRHIARTGRYEPLVVRPHPARQGCFELINGHHRKEVLASLGRTHAACIVWDLDDAETLMLLATVNRLSGEDAPGKRLELLTHLSAQLQAPAAELAKMLPQEEAVLAKLLTQARPGPIAEAPALAEMPEAFTVFLTSADKRRLLAALRKTDSQPAVALMKWAELHGS